MRNETIDNSKSSIDSNKENAKNKSLWLLLIAGLILAIIGLITALMLILKQPNGINTIINQVLSLRDLSIKFGKSQPVDNTAEQSNSVRRTLDGVWVGKGKENNYPAAVVIENHIDSRPPAGLGEANLVFEAEAEGGITRFLAVFASGASINKIGPVRSARPYFLDWAEEFSASFWHCGGSPEALAKIIKDNVTDINEFYNGDLFWRDQARSAPHNVYTSSANIGKYSDAKGLTEGMFLPWQFKDAAAEAERPATATIAIAWPSGYGVEWRYDNSSNSYTRYLAGTTHQDESGKIIAAKNVIIQYATARVIDEEKRLEMNVIGEGEAKICFDGKCQEAVWQKNNQSARTRFYHKLKTVSDEISATSSDNAFKIGEEFEFNAGTTWVEVVRPEILVKY